MSSCFHLLDHVTKGAYLLSALLVIFESGSCILMSSHALHSPRFLPLSFRLDPHLEDGRVSEIGIVVERERLCL